MTSTTPWIPLVVAVITFLSGVLAYLTTERARNRPSPQPDTSSAPVRGPLNGYASILRDTLDRLEWLRQENDHLHRRNDELQQQNGELQHHLDECERRHRTTHTRHASEH